MTENELRGMIINIIHPQYGRPDGKMFDCCYDAEKHSDQLISLLDTPAGIAYLKSQGWVKLDTDQSLPPTRYRSDWTTLIVYGNLKESYTEGQKDTFDAGFRKVKKEFLNGH